MKKSRRFAKRRQTKKAARAYQAGYRRHPEDALEIAAAEAVAVALLSGGD